MTGQTGEIGYDVADGVAVIEIAHGELNTLTPEMHRRMHEVLIEFLGDPAVRCGVLTGRGLRAFCAGDDLRATAPEPEEPVDAVLAELTPHHQRGGAEESWQWEYDVLQLARHKPIVGAVTGWCLGGGFAYLMRLTDLRVAGESARFGLPEIRYGMAGMGGTLRLWRELPPLVANAMLLTGEPIDAREAHRVHLVNEVVADEEAIPRARALARRIAEHPPLSVRLEMEALEQASEMSRAEAVRYGDRIYQLQRLALGESDLESYESRRTRSHRAEGQ
jgi:enoyl-CoA hydratase/carnithine racemase